MYDEEGQRMKLSMLHFFVCELSTYIMQLSHHLRTFHSISNSNINNHANLPKDIINNM